ncbi:hypothetical protein GCM10027598_47330 [Amycolatopsis oliviviridis]|uniref:Uncharacterized protein n=1 Tax=Amycolatopsis oliviviridis TaxID=1471590 RepID=A0ABQ3MBE0_9PSEU|nr:hypothetical protein GCM10017790_82170 [Amycolatopsis oliviviridis]
MPTSASTDIAGRTSSGNMALVTAPSARVGPSRISPITGGCPSRRASAPSRVPQERRPRAQETGDDDRPDPSPFQLRVLRDPARGLDLFGERAYERLPRSTVSRGAQPSFLVE